MNKIKAIAAGMAAVMSVSLLASCAGGAGSKTVVKEDDPWYESSRFLLERDQLLSEFIEGSCVAANDDNVFYLYSLYDMDATDDYRRTVLDTYDNSGKLISSKEIDDSAFNVISGVKDIRVSDDGKTADVISTTWGNQTFQTSRLTIDLESGKVTDEIRSLVEKATASLLGVEYTPVAVIGHSQGLLGRAAVADGGRSDAEMLAVAPLIGALIDVLEVGVLLEVVL